MNMVAVFAVVAGTGCVPWPQDPASTQEIQQTIDRLRIPRVPQSTTMTGRQLTTWRCVMPSRRQARLATAKVRSRRPYPGHGDPDCETPPSSNPR